MIVLMSNNLNKLLIFVKKNGVYFKNTKQPI